MLNSHKIILMKVVEELIDKSMHTKIVKVKSKVNLHPIIYDMSIKWKRCKDSSNKREKT